MDTMQPVQSLVADPPVALSWMECPLSQILDHILVTYHAPLRAELARLDGLILHSLEVPHDGSWRTLTEMARYFSILRAELEPHMDKEERILFPWIRAGRGASVGAPINAMRIEHRQTEAVLARLRSLRYQYNLEAQASPVAQSIVEGLAALDGSLQEHIQLEEILFRRALAT